jgi:ABC-type Fe3+/spermidine/putrescine transport system ATPase subunit
MEIETGKLVLLLRELHARTGHTTLFVTQDRGEAFELADRVAILNEEKIIAGTER